jgi:hypothetical protein
MDPMLQMELREIITQRPPIKKIKKSKTKKKQSNLKMTTVLIFTTVK